MDDFRNPDSTPETAGPMTGLRTTGDNASKIRTEAPSNASQTAGSANPNSPNLEETARRAYELYQKRGGTHGRDQDDWYEAERLLHEERQRSGAPRPGSAAGNPVAKTAAKRSAVKKSTAKKSVAKKSAAGKATTKATGGPQEPRDEG